MEFKREQLNSVLRHRNDIEAVKIKGIEGNDLIIERFNGKTERFPVSYPAEYKEGKYIDMVFFNTGSRSYGMRYIGHTPPQFYPDAGVEKDEV